ncbi:MAG: hypothetical protein SGJ19_27700 [Planctomycetia bacterium]|nr:hypothetical protein [Planctomycetia bacterium]
MRVLNLLNDRVECLLSFDNLGVLGVNDVACQGEVSPLIVGFNFDSIHRGLVLDALGQFAFDDQLHAGAGWRHLGIARDSSQDALRRRVQFARCSVAALVEVDASVRVISGKLKTDSGQPREPLQV